MRTISVYDTDADVIERISEDKDITIAELIQVLVTIIDDGEIDLDDWLQKGELK